MSFIFARAQSSIALPKARCSRSSDEALPWPSFGLPRLPGRDRFLIGRSFWPDTRNYMATAAATWKRTAPEAGHVYLDSAYIAKCYLNEPDAGRVRTLVAGRVGLTSSAWCLAEMACIFQRHVREGGLTRAQAKTLRGLFLGDVAAGVWTLVPVSRSILDAVEGKIQRLRKNVYVRAGDAVHLMTAKLAGFTDVWTNDRHMLGAARPFGLVGRSV